MMIWLVINGMALTINVNRKPLLPMVSDAIKIMFKPTTPFWSGRAMDVLFDGINFDNLLLAFHWHWELIVTIVK